MQPQEKPNFTVQDIYNLPDGQRAELIDGVMYDMAPPSYIHQKLVSRISYVINRYIDDHQGPCEVLSAPFAVFLNADDQTYVEPDISVVCDQKKLSERGCEGAPDFIIEIVSPASQKMDYLIKLWKYRTAGVHEYWIVNPMKETVQVYRFGEDESSFQSSFDEEIPVEVFAGFKICIKELLS